VIVRRLSVAAIVCGALAIGTCFLPWAVPQRSIADLQAELHRMRLDGGDEDPGALMREMQVSYNRKGTDAPFHGVWVIVVAVLAAALAAVGGALSSLPADLRAVAEKTLRTAGVVFAAGAVLVLLDGSPGNFRTADRGTGFWLTLVLTLAACLCATLASARVSKRAAADPVGEEPAAREEEASSD